MNENTKMAPQMSPVTPMVPPQKEEKSPYPDFAKIPLNRNIVLSLAESDRTVETIRKTEQVYSVVSTVLLYIIILILALFMIFPFYWMIITSLKENNEILATTQTFYPTIVMWSNYVYVFQYFKFGEYMLNTIVVAIFSTLGTLITTILAR